MNTTKFCALAASVAALCAVSSWQVDPLRAQSTRRTQSLLAATSVTELRAHDERVTRMLRGGELRVRERVADKLVPGRNIERADQLHQGIRVFGGDVSRQVDAIGQTISVFGTLYDDVAVDTEPRIGEPAARAAVEARSGARLGPAREGELVVLPLDGLVPAVPRTAGAYALAWRLRAATAGDIREYFVDAATGAVIFEYSDLQTQNVVGRATGVLADSKKISVQGAGGSFNTMDGLRPPSIRTYDMKGNPTRVTDVLNNRVTLAQSDLAVDTDNIWTDGAVVDAHVYAGLTYDYYFKRYGRKGLNDGNITMRSMVHPVARDANSVNTQFNLFPEFFTNAFYAGNGFMVYGVGLPSGFTQGGRSWNFMSGALDVVGHELTHGVTDFTSNLIYLNESGALNEAFSDMMGTAIEFFYQPPGDGLLSAEYLCGEDVVRGVSVATNGIRSMASPSTYGHPDHYSIRFLGTTDNGGVHINSGIANHAYYLAIEGGTNRVSGLSVQGVGGANREQIEKVFYRAFTQLMSANSNFAVARAATIQAARDLYGAGNAPERAVMQAWTAVGVN
jgi:bacillolysin